MFAANLEDELLSIMNDLSFGRYVHGLYYRFIVHDPKRRIIHKATVRDRVVHRLIYNALLLMFHRRWLDCSFSCRPGFGQHRSIETAQKFLRQATKNWSDESWILKCDIRKFFDSVDQQILLNLLTRQVHDPQLLGLLTTIVHSFHVTAHCGLPIGNLTSQLFANLYLHELDRYMKHELKRRWYVRYADDFIVIGADRDDLQSVLQSVDRFMQESLKLTLHPNKIFFRKSSWGIDWLGHVLLPGYQILRPSTKKRMLRKAKGGTLDTLVSYHGLLKGTARRTIDQQLLQTFALVGVGDTIGWVGS